MLSREACLMIGLAALALSTSGALAQGKGPVVGVSWSNFQEERWKTDEAAIKAALEAAGGNYISADAQSSRCQAAHRHRKPDRAGRQRADRAGAGSDAIGPAVDKAVAEGIPVVGYDRLIEKPDVFYLTFDNKEVGRMQAREVLKVEAGGQLRLHQGLGRPTRTPTSCSRARWKC